MSHRATRTFAARSREVARARYVLGAWLEAWGLGEVREPLELAVSEVFSNAVRYGEGPIELHLLEMDHLVHIEVWDHGGGLPSQRPVERTGPRAGGWGLHLLDQVVDLWGTYTTDGRTVVWLERATRHLTAQTAHRGMPPSSARPRPPR